VLRARPKYFEREEAQNQQSYGDVNNVNNANYDILLFDRKIALAVEGLEPFFDKILRQTLKENALIIAEYNIIEIMFYAISRFIAKEG
jgi:hypothetical protein